MCVWCVVHIVCVLEKWKKFLLHWQCFVPVSVQHLFTLLFQTPAIHRYRQATFYIMIQAVCQLGVVFSDPLLGERPQHRHQNTNTVRLAQPPDQWVSTSSQFGCSAVFSFCLSQTSIWHRAFQMRCWLKNNVNKEYQKTNKFRSSNNTAHCWKYKAAEGEFSFSRRKKCRKTFVFLNRNKCKKQYNKKPPQLHIHNALRRWANTTTLSFLNTNLTTMHARVVSWAEINMRRIRRNFRSVHIIP